jgi:hypothetical protein
MTSFEVRVATEAARRGVLSVVTFALAARADAAQPARMRRHLFRGNTSRSSHATKLREPT